MAIGRVAAHAVLLGDGRVLVVGNDAAPSSGLVRDDTARAEVWDPLTGTWSATAKLNQPRGDFVAVSLADGRVLVAGGLNQSATGKGCDASDQQSYSSAYVYAGGAGSGSWTKVGLLGIARADAAGAVLPDGRVLVAGGYYQNGANGLRETEPDAVLAAYRPAPIADGPASGPWLDDVAPSTFVPALATAELFDSTTGAWTNTGPMKYARFGAAAVTLADGRVLVVGSSPYRWIRGADRAVTAADQAFDSAEIYDPTTGRFALAGQLPDIDRSAMKAQDMAVPDGAPEPAANGTLVALPNGGALLVGHAGSWKHQGDITRSFRFDPQTGAWTEVGEAWMDVYDDATGTQKTTSGVDLENATVAVLPDGRVLVAGGTVPGTDQAAATDTAQVYDPATNTWSALPPMPQSRAGGAAVVLKDGSVLLVGGYNGQATGDVACDEAAGLRSAIRFVTAP